MEETMNLEQAMSELTKKNEGAGGNPPAPCDL